MLPQGPWHQVIAKWYGISEIPSIKVNTSAGINFARKKFIRITSFSMQMVSAPCLSHVDDAVLKLISRNILLTKNSELSIKTRSTPASLSFKGQANNAHYCEMHGLFITF